MKLINKKKAFTLTELLVVVIVLGALAAVAVPKMSRMLETRKTTEAENIFSAVRTEQEHRCVLGKNYQTDASKVAMLSGVKNKNYTYRLTDRGIQAESKNNTYTLQMPSYKTGEICCSGGGCNNLNKAYQDCATLVALADECAGILPVPPSECSTDHAEGPTITGECTCGGSQTETWHCGADTGYSWNKVSSTSCNECPVPSCGEKPTTLPSCPADTCGRVSGDWKCDARTDYKWVENFDYSGCITKPAPESQECETGEGTRTADYSCEDHEWVLGPWFGFCALDRSCRTIDESNWDKCCAGKAVSDTSCYKTCEDTASNNNGSSDDGEKVQDPYVCDGLKASEWRVCPLCEGHSTEKGYGGTSTSRKECRGSVICEGQTYCPKTSSSSNLTLTPSGSGTTVTTVKEIYYCAIYSTCLKTCPGFSALSSMQYADNL